MGYFDGIVDGWFKRDEKGTHVFYPNGIFGKGYLLPDEPTQNKVRKLVKRWTVVGLSLIIGTQAFFGWKPNALFVGPILITSYYILISKHLKGLSTTKEKLSYSESIRNSTKSHNLVVLMLLFFTSICFVGAGIYMMFNMSHEWLLGLTCILFFSSGGVVVGHMIKIKLGDAK